MEHWGGVRSQLVSQPPETKAPAALDRVTWKRAWVGYSRLFCSPEREKRFICGKKIIHNLSDKLLGMGYRLHIPLFLYF